MTTSSDAPPLPKTDSALRTYVAAILFLLPAFFTWLFTNIILVPRLWVAWEQAGITNTRALLVMLVSSYFANYFGIIAAVVGLVLLLLEFCFAAWRRYRRITVVSLSLIHI